MTHFLDQARDSAADLARLLDGAAADRAISEEDVERFTSMVLGDVRHHNDRLAERAMGAGDE